MSFLFSFNSLPRKAGTTLYILLGNILPELPLLQLPHMHVYMGTLELRYLLLLPLLLLFLRVHRVNAGHTRSHSHLAGAWSLAAAAQPQRFPMQAKVW